MREIHLDRYTPTPAKIMLGTCESYGVEQIKLVPGDGWDGLDMVCTWHPPKGDPVRVIVPAGNVVDVPPEATASPGDGALVVAGMADGVLLASCNVEYRVTKQAGVAGKPADEPTPDLVQQVVSAANKATEVADGVRKDMDKVLVAETGRETAETARAAAETARQEAESARAAAETSREAAESDRAAAENARQQAEAARKYAEYNRAEAETTRQTDEAARQIAEAARQSSESTRESAEADRVKAEESRVSEETTRASAESKRASAESARASAETKRASAETARASAETARASAETSRVSAESARVTAEQSRATAEADRVKAETARVDAENQREQDFAAMKEQVDSKAEIDDTAVTDTAAWSSKQIIDTLCPPLEETGNPVVCYPVANYPLGVTVSWEPTQEGSGDPSPDNIRPITGRDSIKVMRTGINLLQASRSVSFTQVIKLPQWIPAGVYYISAADVQHGGRKKPVIALNDAAGNITSSELSCDIVTKITLKRTCTLCYLYSNGYDYNGSAGISATINDLMLSHDVPELYTPYTGMTATMSLPSTIYGGSWDVATGNIDRTTVAYDYTKNKWQKGKVESGWAQSDDATAWFVYIAGVSELKPICNILASIGHEIAMTQKPYTIGYGNGYIALRLPISVASTSEEINDFLTANSAEIYVKLAWPKTSAATGGQPIPALSGVNTLLTDADTLTVTGRADPIKRITDLETSIASMTTAE